MNDIQRIVDSLKEVSRMQRQPYHLKLGQLIDFLERCEGTLPVNFDIGGQPGKCDSYRGYYEDLAFSTTGRLILVSDFLKEVKDANLKTFEGYKGGDFKMDDGTCLWVSEYGSVSGTAITGVSVVDDAVVLETRQMD